MSKKITHEYLMASIKRYIIMSVLLLSCTIRYKTNSPQEMHFIHGAADCKTTIDPPIQVIRYDANTWILRQSKCVHYEGPFMYLFVGKKKALLMDTGATPDEKRFPLYRTVDSLLTQWKQLHHVEQLELVVAHTHGHGDHIAADNQFLHKPGVTVVGTSVEAVKTFFALNNWPQQPTSFDLGDRVLDIVPIPGHHVTSIAVYDHATKILLTGDSFYPGRLYIKDWQAFSSSTQRLVDFVSTHRVSYILGNHIEMTTVPGKDYPSGTTFQPDEHPLPMKRGSLFELNDALKKIGDKPAREVHNDFIIWPV